MLITTTPGIEGRTVTEYLGSNMLMVSASGKAQLEKEKAA